MKEWLALTYLMIFFFLREGFLIISDLAGAPADDPSAEAVAAEEAFAEPAPAEAAPPEGAPEHGGDYSGFGADFGGASVPTGDAAASVGDLSFVGGELMGYSERDSSPSASPAWCAILV